LHENMGGVEMLIAANHNKDSNVKLSEDEITSCVFGPLSFMGVKDVWALFSSWLPFDPSLWPNESPSKVYFSFWPNLSKEGRIEPDLLIRFENDQETMLTIMLEVKWESPISGELQLVNQWASLTDAEKKRTFHVYLVKETPSGIRDRERSLSQKVPFKKETWKKRLVCVGWQSLIETIRFDRPKFSDLMKVWADGVLSFLMRRGLTVFTGFEWVSGDVEIPEKEIFWKTIPWFSILKGQSIDEEPKGNLFWKN
jgi:hypothetical protein